ncbi:MAG: ATP-binding cassette domain-containing protein [Cytophagaceae bacterium]|nr:ATP-binding cassette domain-containing protein [Cytophagaceae bacterium]
MSEILIDLQNASIRRPEAIALQNVNWTLRTGEHWAILGKNGCGKSSFLQALAGKLSVIGGTFHHPVGALSEAVELLPKDFSFNRIVASAAQFYQQRFNSYASDEVPTVREVLQNQMRPVGTISEASVALAPAQYGEDWLTEVADWVNITHLLDRRLTSLSNGETRRTLLARSLLKRPRILLLDNPFVGLDVASRQRLHETLNRISANVTLVLVTTPDEVPACVTHILELPAARIFLAASREQAPPPAAIDSGIDPVLLRRFGQNPIPSDFENAVKMRRVSVKYGAVRVLDSITWTVKRGEKWAVLGPNGSGKSTLLSLITADNPQGYANDFDLFDRQRGTGESIWDIKQKIGFVSPELHLYFPQELPVWKVVASGLFDTAGLFRKLTDEQTNRLELILGLLKLAELREKRFGQLSTGQQRWALLGRALVKNPPLLILDEPGQGLDAEHVSRFRDLVDELCQHTDRTLLYVSHYAGEIPRCVTKTLRLDAGGMTEVATN